MTGIRRIWPMHHIALIVVPPVMSFDVSIPYMVFGSVPDGYVIEVCAAEPGVVATAAGPAIVVPNGLDVVRGADTVIAVGSGGEPAHPAVLEALRAAATEGVRIASLCTGAFVLAQAGLLDGRPATTHWGLAAKLSAEYPRVEVRPDVLFVDDGQVLTSAGAAASIDLCLHLVRLDHGAATANRAAREAVVAPVRPGGQAQFIETPLPPDGDRSLTKTRAWVRECLARPPPLKALAAPAGMSARPLTRRFHAETG